MLTKRLALIVCLTLSLCKPAWAAVRKFAGSTATDNINYSDKAVFRNLFDSTMTALIWGNMTSLDLTSRRMFDKESATGGWFFSKDGGLCNGVSNQVKIDTSDVGADGVWCFTDNTTGAWEHLAFTIDGSSVNNNALMYKNAVSQTVTSITPGGIAGTDLAVNLEIGNGGITPNTRAWLGDLAHGELHNVILTVNEIKQTMFYPCSVQRGIVFCSPLLGAAPEGEYKNNNTGTVTNATTDTSQPPINGLFVIPSPGSS